MSLPVYISSEVLLRWFQKQKLSGQLRRPQSLCGGAAGGSQARAVGVAVGVSQGRAAGFRPFLSLFWFWLSAEFKCLWDSRSSHWPGDSGRHGGLGWPWSWDHSTEATAARATPTAGHAHRGHGGLQGTEPELAQGAEEKRFKGQPRRAPPSASLAPPTDPSFLLLGGLAAALSSAASSGAPSIAACRGRPPGVQAPGTHLRDGGVCTASCVSDASGHLGGQRAAGVQGGG